MKAGKGLNVLVIVTVRGRGRNSGARRLDSSVMKEIKAGEGVSVLAWLAVVETGEGGSEAGQRGVSSGG